MIEATRTSYFHLQTCCPHLGMVRHNSCRFWLAAIYKLGDNRPCPWYLNGTVSSNSLTLRHLKNVHSSEDAKCQILERGKYALSFKLFFLWCSSSVILFSRGWAGIWLNTVSIAIIAGNAQTVFVASSLEKSFVQSWAESVMLFLSWTEDRVQHPWLCRKHSRCHKVWICSLQKWRMQPASWRPWQTRSRQLLRRLMLLRYH